MKGRARSCIAPHSHAGMIMAAGRHGQIGKLAMLKRNCGRASYGERSMRPTLNSTRRVPQWGQFAGRELMATPAGRKFQGEVQIARAAGADLGGQVDRQSAN